MVGGSASSGSSVVQRAAPASRSCGEHLVDVPRRVLELDGQRQVRRPGREERGEPVVVAPDVVGHAEQDGPEPLAELPERTRQPRDARDRVDEQRAVRAAPLGLDRKPEVGRRGVEPRGNLGRGRLLVVGVVQLAGRQARGVVTEEGVTAEAGGIEARRPRRDRRTRWSRPERSRS